MISPIRTAEVSTRTAAVPVAHRCILQRSATGYFPSCPVASRVELKMSQFVSISSIVQRHYDRDRRNRQAVRYGAAIVQKIIRDPAPVESWPDGKLMAILMILRSEAARDCISHWSGSNVRASQYDFLALREEGLAFKRELSRFHELTDAGNRFAADACTLVAKRLGLHHIDRKDTSDSVSAKCTCGYRISFSRKYGNETSQLEGAINRHLSDTDEWKRRREAVAAVMNDVVAKIGGGDAG